MRLKLSVQYAAPRAGLPAKSSITRWAQAALPKMKRTSLALCVRIVGAPESAALNRYYRGKDGPTNVLSFPFECPPGARTDTLGDLVICAPVVRREAARLAAPTKAHWAHMVIHGILHLRGYDHRNRTDATAMENLESRILKGLGFPDPYIR